MIDFLGHLLDYASGSVVRAWSAIVIIAIAAVRSRTEAQRQALRQLLRAASRPTWQSALLVGVASLAMSVSVFLVRGTPLPHSPDEYATLLVADTLAHGRLANPPHPHWQHFETQIVLQRPTYASAYPLGNGALLLLGRVLFGLEIAGVWIASACAAGLTVWAARAWITPAWSLLAGLIIAVHPTFTWWNIGYMGGSVAACGAALLLGAALRLVRRPGAAMTAVGALGLALLAHTRPWEGLLFTLGVASMLLLAMRSRVMRIVRQSAPAAIILIAALTLVALHNRAVTGSATTLPHHEFDRQYQVVPNFLWQELRPEPDYRTAEMHEAYARTYRTHYDRIFEPGGVFEVLVVSKLTRIFEFLFPWREAPNPGIVEAAYPLFFVPLLLLPWSIRRPKSRRLLLVFAVSMIAPFAMTWWVSSQYLAPIASLLALLYVLLAREMVVRFPRFGSAIVLALILFGVAYGVGAARVIAKIPQSPMEAQRQSIIAGLERAGGKHLILVPQSAKIVIANRADLDGTPVVWARERSAAENVALVRDYRDRTVWRVVGNRATFRVQRVR